MLIARKVLATQWWEGVCMFAKLCLASSVPWSKRPSEICRTEKRQKESNGTTNSDSKFFFLSPPPFCSSYWSDEMKGKRSGPRSFATVCSALLPGQLFHLLPWSLTAKAVRIRTLLIPGGNYLPPRLNSQVLYDNHHLRAALYTFITAFEWRDNIKPPGSFGDLKWTYRLFITAGNSLQQKCLIFSPQRGKSSTNAPETVRNHPHNTLLLL